MEVHNVGFDSAARSPVVVLEDHDRRVALPIWIGAAEAQAIALQIQGISTPRPMTHDLIKTMLDSTGVEFRRVVIGEIKQGAYLARIHLHAGSKDLEIDSRPSDAIALAVRFQRPIFVATTLLKGEPAVDLTRHAATATATYAGITAQNLTDDMAEFFHVPTGSGVVVANIAVATPDGLQRGDVVLQIDGDTVTGVGDFERKLRNLPSGRPARLTVQRGGEQVQVAFVSPKK